MKYMKLGTRPDTFYTAEAVRSVSTEVSSDLIVQVKSSRYLLHKFPLLSKCLRLQQLCSESTDAEPVIELSDFPGGIEAFEICAKFCYGITITLSAFNIVSVRCAAEYLRMTEDVEKGNLIYKLEIFFNSCVLRGWKDTIVTLQTTKSFALWSEDLGITSRCIDAIVSRVLIHPSKVNWPYSYSRGNREGGQYNSIESQNHKLIPKGWWAEDIAELGINFYWRVMLAIKSSGKVPANLIGEALQVYSCRWLPNISKDTSNKQVTDACSDPVGEITSRHRFLLESIVSLLPMEKGSVSCSFLLKLLKAANILGASSSSKMELARRVGIQLEEATVRDLLIPSLSHANETLYDVDIVMTILEQFMLQGQSPPTSPPRARAGFERRRSRSAENVDFEFQESRRSSSASHSSKLKVTKLIDNYLQEIARDANLPLQKVIALAEAVPDFARPDHDDLYRVIDIYLKSHSDLDKSERKRLCRILDCKKLSMEACIHAAQNELLPLRVVVQVLFFEQARAAMSGAQVTELPSNLKALLTAHEDDASRPSQLHGAAGATAEDEWSISGLKSPKSKLSTLRMKLAEADGDMDDDVMQQDGSGRTSKLKALCSIPTKPKRMLSKLWSINRSISEKH
ncbi:BTB/POZ domain-containing protein At1g67900 [Magnolia sinica]|uniref:BTB/POZ domain-containing protein At1g67900 n=1 Tax=Magnolia sinica TaxID=86752 RepID=UPI002657FF65|nr:BTB/POZ domain-containing protein At1g67900 [Magnolia sinica]XP_058093713.1 BTB/POZ domain-containing protein At1g67900 [Magnolia sinica]